ENRGFPPSDLLVRQDAWIGHGPQEKAGAASDTLRRPTSIFGTRSHIRTHQAAARRALFRERRRRQGAQERRRSKKPASRHELRSKQSFHGDRDRRQAGCIQGNKRDRRSGRQRLNQDCLTGVGVQRDESLLSKAESKRTTEPTAGQR